MARHQAFCFLLTKHIVSNTYTNCFSHPFYQEKDANIPHARENEQKMKYDLKYHFNCKEDVGWHFMQSEPRQLYFVCVKY